ncbi:MAG: TetR family transcriptional regulator [Candidatus Limnocylindria bacterium]
MPRTGRRPGRSGTREKILEAARSQFTRHGYDRATIRAIAAAARVDPALVLHYFGAKEGVFLAAMELPADPARFVPMLVAPGLDGIGERMVRFYIETWDSPEGASLIGLLRSAVSNEKAAAMLREFLERAVLGRLALALTIDHPKLRGSLAGSQLMGLAMMRYVVRLEPFASAGADELARWAGPAVQRCFTGELGPAPRRRASRAQVR